MPIPDDPEHGEAERRGPGGQAVEAIGEVDRVGSPHQDERREHHPTGLAEVDPRMIPAGEGQRRRDVCPVERQLGEEHPGQDLRAEIDLARLFSPRLRR